MCENKLANRKLLVALATYNEIENLPRLVKEILDLVPTVDVLIVDDNSPDGTGRWAVDASKNDSRVRAIIRENERGLGSAVICALKYAAEEDYDFVVNMDADFSHPPQMIPKLFQRISQDDEPVDVVIASRYVKGGGTQGWPLRRRIMSRCVNCYARIALGLKTRDNSGSYRCYRVSKLEKLNFDQFLSQGYSFFEETLFRLKEIGARFEELPFVFVDRLRGTSKINVKESIKAVRIISRLGLKRVFRKPDGGATRR